MKLEVSLMISWKRASDHLVVSIFQRAISMVIPRSRSAFSLSKTQAYLKDPLPNSAASCCGISSCTKYIEVLCEEVAVLMRCGAKMHGRKNVGAEANLPHQGG